MTPNNKKYKTSFSDNFNERFLFVMTPNTKKYKTSFSDNFNERFLFVRKYMSHLAEHQRKFNRTIWIVNISLIRQYPTIFYDILKHRT